MPRFVTRRVLYSMDFDGNNDYINFGANFDKERTDSFGYSCFVKLDVASGKQIIIQKRNNDAAGWEFSFGATSNAFRFLMEGSNGNQLVVDSETVNTGEWYFVCLTYDGTSLASGVNIYTAPVGEAIKTHSLTTVDNSLDANITNAGLCIAGLRLDLAEDFNGRMTAMRIHNAELSSADVEKVYYSNNSISTEGYWKLDEGSGTTANATIGAVNGLIGGANWSTDVPLFKGRFNTRSFTNSIHFDGTADNVTWADDDSLTPATITLECWWKQIGSTTSFRDILGKWVSGQQSYLFYTNAGTIWFSLQTTAGPNNFNTGITIPFHRWTHFVCVYDGTNLILYINGKQAATTLATNTGSVNNSTSAFNLGKRASGGQSAIGKMALARVFGSSATADQVAGLFEKNELFATPVIEALMTDGSGTTVTNTGSYAPDGTATGIVWDSSDLPRNDRSAISSGRTVLTANRTGVS